MTDIALRPATPADADAVWDILAPIIRAGEVFTHPRDMPREAALAHWLPEGGLSHVAVADGIIVGVYYLRANQAGGGPHVANAGYATRTDQSGKGIARTLCAHSLDTARANDFTAMQFNFVVSTNVRAVALWQAMGFGIVGTLPGAFEHPRHGLVDAYVMYRTL
jgi:ribosomal protein S18 acetylase RimI-like enzyme